MTKNDRTAEGSTADVLKESLALGRDAFGRSQIFGDPITHGDVVLVPVGKMRGGGGGGGGTGTGMGSGDAADHDVSSGEGSGHGWGMDAKATGAFVISNGKVKFVPVVEVNRIVIASMAGSVLIVLLTPRIVRAAMGTAPYHRCSLHNVHRVLHELHVRSPLHLRRANVSGG